MLRQRERRPSLSSRDTVLLVLSFLVPIVLLAVALDRTWRGAAQLARQRVERIADTMHEHVLKVVETQDLALDRVADHLVARPDGAIDGRELAAMLEQIIAKLEHTVSMWVSDADGVIVAGSLPWNPDQRMTVHAFWRRLRESDAGTVIGSRSSGAPRGLPRSPLPGAGHRRMDRSAERSMWR